MATGNEPVSTGNLSAVLAGAGYPKMDALFTGSSVSVTLPRPVDEYSFLLCVTGESSSTRLRVIIIDPSMGSRFEYDYMTAQISGQTVRSLSSAYVFKKIISVTF